MSSATDVVVPAAAAVRVRRRIVVRGIVQGVGFRPFVYVTATELGLTGWVTNDSSGVIIEAEGTEADVAELTRRLVDQPPPLARVDGIVVSAVVVQRDSGFVIHASSHSGAGRTLASPDVATCSECLAELADPANRRFRHPFITCTNCGPRFTIILDLPYDRPATTMAGFSMCPACAAEYDDSRDRRFHAQTIACPKCGPVVSLRRPGRAPLVADEAIAEARSMLSRGAILAVKGIGGYHLMCDAADDDAVGELRRRKRRGDKPFAVLTRDLAVARRLAVLNEREADLLTSAARPIVLVPRRARSAMVAPSVAPRVPDLGLMLPYTPMQVLLLGLPGDPPGPEAFVATSGNLSGEPIVADDDEALRRLAPLVDGWLTHDRPIHVPCDDSVLRVVDGEQLPLRRARGYAPLPVALPIDVVPTLASGADLKNTCCLGSGRQGWVSQHIGDMDDLTTLAAFTTTERLMESLTGVVPQRFVADGHPSYRSSAWARQRAAGRPLQTAQHHHAHIASLMGEHGLAPGTKVIGVAFDGTGFGGDGAIWGGEVLIADYEGFERFAHLRYVPLPGGDAAVERPYRMALAHLTAAGLDWDPNLACVAACPPTEARVLAQQLASGLGCVPTSSMGRLFDAVAALCGVRQVVDYEAQAAIELEGFARDAASAMWQGGAYAFGLCASGGATSVALEADAAPVIRAIVTDLHRGATTTQISVRFHGAVVALVVELAARAWAYCGLTTVGLSGGVFQNPVLLSRSARALQRRGFTVLRHHLVPPNDGGVALGQLLVSSAGAAQKGDPSCA